MHVTLAGTWMGGHQGKLDAVNLSLFVGGVLNLRLIIYLAVILLTWTYVNQFAS